MPDDRDLFAAEYVLGLLPDDERARAEALVTDDPVFAEMVATWEARFADFYAEIAPVEPDRDLWPLIDARLPRAANDDAPMPGAGPWKVATGVFGAIAASLALALVLRPEPVAPPTPEPQIVQAPTETLVAQLNDGEGASMLAARVDPDDGLRIRATAIPNGSGEPELWVIPTGGAPVSLGLIAREGESRVALTPEYRRLVIDGATLALTLEPREGAPHDAPSGDILGTARITRL